MDTIPTEEKGQELQWASTEHSQSLEKKEMKYWKGSAGKYCQHRILCPVRLMQCVVFFI